MLNGSVLMESGGIQMPDRKKVIKGLEICSEHGSWHGVDCEYNEAYKDCPYRGCETGCVVTIAKDAIVLLKEQEAVEPDTDSKGTCFCGNCGEIAVGYFPAGCSTPLKFYKFCPVCGRPVKWDD